MEHQYQRLYETLMGAARDITGFLGNPNMNPIPFSEVQNQEGIDRAIDCAASMQKSGTYRGERIGLVNPDIPDIFGMGSLRRNQVILFQNEDDGTATVQVPYTLEAIAQQRAKGSLICSSTIINVPLNYIRELVP